MSSVLSPYAESLELRIITEQENGTLDEEQERDFLDLDRMVEDIAEHEYRYLVALFNS
jgi:hypothetical protein